MPELINWFGLTIFIKYPNAGIAGINNVEIAISIYCD